MPYQPQNLYRDSDKAVNFLFDNFGDGPGAVQNDPMWDSLHIHAPEGRYHQVAHGAVPVARHEN